MHDNNSDKAFGGRIGYAYLPGFEAGFSYYRGAYDDDGNLDFKSEAIDLTYVGRYFTLRGEYIRTATDALGTPIEPTENHLDDEVDHVDSQVVVPTTSLKRDGWYGQASWQLRSFDHPLLNPIELVVRHSQVNKIEEAKRWTFGVNYWWKPSSVFKLSFDRTELTSGRKVNRILTQFSHGF